MGGYEPLGLEFRNLNQDEPYIRLLATQNFFFCISLR